MIQAKLRDYFSTELFNSVVEEYFEHFLDNFIARFTLKSAKGSSGKEFEDSRRETVRKQFDTPYHIHILNGLLPTLKMLEERFKKEGWDQPDKQAQADIFLRCFITGFTFHDINKLSGTGELIQDVEQYLIPLCDELKLEKFFSEWKNWTEEIKFLALGTEYRTKIYAHQTIIKDYDFFNTVLADYCHFADSIASMDGFENVANFYTQLRNRQFDGKKLSTLWQLSFIEVQENIFTLLSQKLLHAAKHMIKNVRQQPFLFSLRNGFVYIGKPLTKDEIMEIKVSFKGNLSDVAKSALLDHQTCKLGFLENLVEEDGLNNHRYHKQIENALEIIIKAGLTDQGAGSESIKPFSITSYAGQATVNAKPTDIDKLEEIIDQNELPLQVVTQKAKDGTIQNYFLRLSNEWADNTDEDKLFLTLYVLEKMKLLYSGDFPQWKPNFSPLHQYSTVTNRTVTALLSALLKLETGKSKGESADIILQNTRNDFIETLESSKFVKTMDTRELDEFVNLYLSGNFDRDLEKISDFIDEIPEKKDMCIFTGRGAKTKYGDNRAFGIKALNFNNRSLNTLKSKDNGISSLFFQENEFRLKELPRGFYTKKLEKEDKSSFNRRMFWDAAKADTVIYYDFGEYFVEVSSQRLLEVLGKAMSFDCRDINGLTLIFQEYAYDYNLYGMNFNKTGNDVKSNFFFIHRILKLIQKTGFRIFVSSILTPYHQHREMFVFDNCMPFVKTLGWDKIRIDQIEDRLREMNLLLTLDEKRLISNILNYAEDRQYLFTAFAQLDEDNKARARNGLLQFINSNMEVLRMSVMNELAQISIEMVRPKSGSASQESWVIRDSLKVLKDCYKEERDKDTTIEQIAGDLRKTLKGRDYADISKCEPFAKALYEKLFEQEWKKHFPQPNRLRNWVNQFAFLYSDKGYTEMRKSKVKGVIKKLKEEGRDISEDAVINYIINDNKKLEKYADDYREVFQDVFAEFK